MAIHTGQITLDTQGEGDTHDVTPLVQNEVTASELSAGVATVFVPGSTAGLTTIEFESGVIRDLAAMFDRAIPRDMVYEHNERWGDGNGYSHVRAALLGPSLAVPFSGGTLMTGTWQQIVLIDFDNRARNRRLIVQVMGE